jgi:cell shape-determining protein MreC
MPLSPIEKLKKEVTKTAATLQSEKKKNQALKEENRQLHKKVNGMEGEISRSKEQNVLLKKDLQEELKKNVHWNHSSTTY